MDDNSSFFTSVNFYGQVPKIAVDWPIIQGLTKLNSPEFTPNDFLIKLVDGSLNGLDFRKIPYDKRPMILQDKWLAVEVRDKNRCRTGRLLNLERLFILYEGLMTGKLNLCVLPTVFAQVVQNEFVFDFVTKYMTILSVPDQFQTEFENRVTMLSQQYLINGALDEIYEVAGIEHKNKYNIRKMAEATVFGVYFVVTHDLIFVHRHKRENYERANKIQDINISNGYVYYTNKGSDMSVKPLSLSTFCHYYKHELDNNSRHSFYTLSNNINHNGIYISPV